MAGDRPAANFCQDQGALRGKFAYADLRFRAAGGGDAAIFYDVGDTRAASLRADGNHGDMHHG